MKLSPKPIDQRYKETLDNVMAIVGLELSGGIASSFACIKIANIIQPHYDAEEAFEKEQQRNAY
jgi:hypothetical protein